MTSQRPISSLPESNGDEAPVRALDLRPEFPPPTIEQWRRLVEQDLKGAEFDKKLLWQTPEGITVKPLYTAADREGLPHVDEMPGSPAFARGTYPLSGVAPEWQVRQDNVLATPEEVNGAVRDGLARGQTAVCFRLDNAARRGFDGDADEARELAGRGGCTISSIYGLRIALQDIDIARHPVTMRTGTSALPLLAMLIALADERGIRRDALVGAVESDPIRSLAKNGRLRAPLDVLYREMADMASFCARECPGVRSVLVNSSPWHNSGGSAVQELGYSLATGAEYLRELIRRGIDPDAAALSLSFSFSVTTNLFPEIAKLRAARILWAKIVRAFGARDEEAWKMFLHARTSTWNKTIHDPYNNMVRTSLEAFAAAVGGCESMYVAPFDEPLGRPSDFSMRIARNQQLLLREEAYLSQIVDPAGGSYYVEALTDAMAREAWKLFQEVEGEGGMVASLVNGSPQKAIAETAGRKMAAIAQRRQSIVGVNTYPNPKEKLPEPRQIPREEFLAMRRKRLARLKSLRKNSRVRELLAAMTQAVYSEEGNLLEIGIEAAREGATIGEIIRAIGRGAAEESIKIDALEFGRASIPFEQLRDRAARHAQAAGAPPKAFLVPMGPLAMRRARADFCHGFFGAGGFEIIEPPAFKDVDAAAKAALECGARIIVACSDDASYPEIVPALAKKIKAAKPNALLIVAGYPQDTVEQLKKSGADGFVHLRANALETLGELMTRIGVA